MAEPVSWLTVLAVKSLLQRITEANDFLTEIGSGRVLTDRTQVRAENGPYILITGDTITPAPITGSVRPSKTNHGIGMTVQYVLPLASADPAVGPELMAHRAAADLRRALGADIRDQSAGFRELVINQIEIGQPPEGAGANEVLVVVSVVATFTDRDTTPTP